MEFGPALFVLFLLSVGILMIVFVRKGLKEQALSQERSRSAALMSRRAVVPRARRSFITSTLEQSTPWERLSDSSVREAFEKFWPEDPWRSLTASRVSEAFEEFTRKL
jgi:hypothetical protein